VSLFNLNKIIEIPLEGYAQTLASNLIQYTQQTITGPGNGKYTLPLARVLDILAFDEETQTRILENREDILLKSPKGKPEGTLENRGKRMREAIPDMPNFTLDMVGEKLIQGNFQVEKDSLKITELQGLKVKKSVRNWFDLTYNVEFIVLTPKSIVVF